MSWTAAQDDKFVTGYQVIRDGQPEPVATVTGTSYTDGGLQASTRYSYRIRAIDSANQLSPDSLAAAARTYGTAGKFNPGHYVRLYPSTDARRGAGRFGLDELNSPFLGVKRLYYWRDLEPAKDVYDFTKIDDDLKALEEINSRLAEMNTLQGGGKPAPVRRLMITLQDVDWGINEPPAAPAYLLTSEYAHGVFRRASGDRHPFIPKRYNAKVSERLQAIYRALGTRYDSHPLVELISTEETSLGVSKANDVTAVVDADGGNCATGTLLIRPLLSVNHAAYFTRES